VAPFRRPRERQHGWERSGELREHVIAEALQPFDRIGASGDHDHGNGELGLVQWVLSAVVDSLLEIPIHLGRVTGHYGGPIGQRGVLVERFA
jgi:hypothetical protein